MHGDGERQHVRTCCMPGCIPAARNRPANESKRKKQARGRGEEKDAHACSQLDTQRQAGYIYELSISS